MTGRMTALGKAMKPCPWILAGILFPKTVRAAMDQETKQRAMELVVKALLADPHYMRTTSLIETVDHLAPALRALNDAGIHGDAAVLRVTVAWWQARGLPDD